MLDVLVFLPCELHWHKILFGSIRSSKKSLSGSYLFGMKEAENNSPINNLFIVPFR